MSFAAILHSRPSAALFDRRTQGEHLKYTTNMSVSQCRVSFNDLDGVTHAVEVDAESLYEAVALAVGAFRQDEIATDQPGPMTEFSVVVVRKAVEHKIRFGRVQRWVQPSTVGGPALKVKRETLRRVLEGSG